MRTKRVLRAAVAFLLAFGVLAAALTPLRLPPQPASAGPNVNGNVIKPVPAGNNARPLGSPHHASV